MKRKRIKKTAITVILICAALLPGLAALSCSSKGYSGPVETIKFGDLAVDSNLFIYIAQEQGYFAENGINLVITHYDTGPAALDALVNQDIDLTAMGEFPVVGKAFTKESIGIIGTIDKFRSFYLVGRKDRGIQTVADFKGKSIGLVKNALPEFYLGRLLEMNHMSIKDVAEVSVSPAQWVNAINNGDVDGIVVAQSYLEKVQSQLADNSVTFPLQSDQFAFGVLVCRNDWIAQHTQLVKNLLTALAQAERYLNTHLELSKNILAKRFSYDAAYMGSLWPEHRFSLLVDQSLILAMEDEARWMISNSLTTEKIVPNFLDYVYTDGLKAVKPGAVSIAGK